MKKIAFIVNPISGISHKEVILLYLKSVFTAENGYDALFHKTECVGDAYVKALNFSDKGYDIVVAIGGDGTVNEVARGLVNRRTKLGIIPVGSGNGLARHLKIPISYQKAAEVIMKENVQKIDAGKINDQSVNKNYIRDHLCEYQRQYRGYLNSEGDSVVSVHYLLGDYNELGIDSEILMVYDGGETVWDADVNLSKNAIEQFNVNGVG